MPYQSNDELPDAVKKAYATEAERTAFREAFNRCYQQPQPTENECFRIAHGAAKRARGGEES